MKIGPKRGLGERPFCPSTDGIRAGPLHSFLNHAGCLAAAQKALIITTERRGNNRERRGKKEAIPDNLLPKIKRGRKKKGVAGGGIWLQSLAPLHQKVLNAHPPLWPCGAHLEVHATRHARALRTTYALAVCYAKKLFLWGLIKSRDGKLIKAGTRWERRKRSWPMAPRVEIQRVMMLIA